MVQVGVGGWSLVVPGGSLWSGFASCHAPDEVIPMVGNAPESAKCPEKVTTKIMTNRFERSQSAVQFVNEGSTLCFQELRGPHPVPKQENGFASTNHKRSGLVAGSLFQLHVAESQCPCEQCQRRLLVVEGVLNLHPQVSCRPNEH